MGLLHRMQSAAFCIAGAVLRGRHLFLLRVERPGFFLSNILLIWGNAILQEDRGPGSSLPPPALPVSSQPKCTKHTGGVLRLPIHKCSPTVKEHLCMSGCTCTLQCLGWLILELCKSVELLVDVWVGVEGLRMSGSQF